MDTKHMSPSSALISIEKKGFEENWQSVQYLARLYVNFVPPTSGMREMVPTWPTSCLFAGYKPFEKYFEIYFGKLNQLVFSKKDIRALVELIRLFCSGNEWDNGWEQGVIVGPCFSGPCKYSKKIEQLRNELEQYLNPADELKGGLDKWSDDIKSTSMCDGFGGPPNYEFGPFCGDDGKRSLFDRFSYGEDFCDVIDSEQVVSCGSFGEKLKWYGAHRQDLALRLMRTAMDDSLWRGDVEISKVVVDMFAHQYNAICPMNENPNFCEMADHLVECIEDEEIYSYADREFRLLLQSPDFKCASDKVCLVEDKALLGSEKACLQLHDYCLKQKSEINCMTDFWWVLRDYHLKRT